MRNETCCFTGDSPHKLPYGFEEDHPDCIKLIINIVLEIEAMIKKGCSTFITGMDLGPEIWFAELVLDLKHAYPQRCLKLMAAIPYEEQANRWDQDYQERYYRILSQVDDAVTMAAHYYDGCMQERNQYMITHAAHMIAVCNGSNGSIKDAIEYAYKRGLDTVILNPIDFSESRAKPFRDFTIVR